MCLPSSSDKWHKGRHLDVLWELCEHCSIPTCHPLFTAGHLSLTARAVISCGGSSVKSDRASSPGQMAPGTRKSSPSFSCPFPECFLLTPSIIALEVQQGGNMPRRALGWGDLTGECAALLHHFHVCWSHTEFSVLMTNFFSLWEEANWQLLSPSPNLSLFYCLLTTLALPFL